MKKFPEINKINNLVELFFNQYENQFDKSKILLSSLKEPRKNYSWQETFNSINKLSEELKKFVNIGDRCLLISENRPEWFISDLSIMLSGSITVPAYTTYADRDYEYIINDCTPSVIFVSNTEQFNKIKNIIKNKNFIKKVFSFDNLENENHKDYQNISNLFNDLKNEKNIPKSEMKRKDPACIIYTSGTQGNPKGVILSHGGILNNCEGAIEILEPLIQRDQTRFLTWLPLSHSYEHTVQFVQITVSARVFYAESIEKLIKNRMK
jgi:Long-chain acyl-CoA synthetases (AMP-forming)